MSEILSTSTKKFKSNKKKYKCPYCEKRLTREDMALHIEKYHEDMIPKGYTANRVAFNTINKKDHGRCVICGKESPWNETKCRYDRFCGNPACKKKAAKIAEQNTHRHAQLRSEKGPEIQKQMLSKRRISGKYKFSTGGEIEYVGSYEKEFLKAMDLIMGVNAEDIQQPGPVIQYTYNGKKRDWITDFYYIPYNLVFDIKDGGDNPNTREMEDYRQKQIEKEKAIRDQGKYNYIRATNKEFDQVFSIMAELKELMMDPDYEVISRIHEAMSPMIFSLPACNTDRVCVVNYLQNNVFAGKEDRRRYALCRDGMYDIVVYDGENFVRMDLDEFTEMASDIECYMFMEDADFMEVLENSKTDKDFYTVLTNKKLLSYDQIKYDPMFKKVLPMSERLDMLSQCIEATAFEYLNNKVVVESGPIQIPIVALEIDDKTGLQLRRDLNGEFLYNEFNNLRSPSYESRDDIPEEMIEFLSELI